MIRVDIIMGVYNCEKTIKESIDSVLKQTFKDWRLIICDDKSTDRTLVLVEEYAKMYPNRIIVLKNKENRGLNYSLNRCLSVSNAEYVARQDGDDLSKPIRLEREIAFLDNNKKYAMVSSNMVLFDENGEWGKTKKITSPSKNDLIDGTPFCHAPCMVRRSVMVDLGGYCEDKSTIRVEDYDLWFRMYEKGYVGYNISDCLYKMRDDKNSARRRTVRNRINEYKLKKRIYKSFGMQKKHSFKVIAPLLKIFIPSFIYRFVYNMKYKVIREELA